MKPKEWWITNPDGGYNGIYNSDPTPDVLSAFHVIEYSAYEDLKKEYDELLAFISGRTVSIKSNYTKYYLTITDLVSDKTDETKD